MEQEFNKNRNTQKERSAIPAYCRPFLLADKAQKDIELDGKY